MAHAGRTVDGSARFVLSPSSLAGIIGGALWAALVALLRDRFSANEILVSLMLVYVAEMLLGYLIYGPWKDPDGYNFPQTITFLPVDADAAASSRGIAPHLGLLVAWGARSRPGCFCSARYRASSSQVGGQAPRAARYAGLLGAAGALDGAAGLGRAGGPGGRARGGRAARAAHAATCRSGYGFAAIIVAFVGRLHPFGILLSSLLMSMLYIGGELAQSRLGLPQALTGRLPGPPAVHAARLRRAGVPPHRARRTARAGGDG